MQLRPLIAALAMLCSAAATAQFVPSAESLSGLYPGKAYSPFAQRAFPSRVYWGDTHLHTGLSMDAGLFGNTTGLDTAYRFAKGEEVMAASGQPVRLGRPLDWLVLTEHSDGMGMVQDIAKGAPDILESEQGRRWHEGMSQGGDASAEAALDLIGTFSQGKIDPNLIADYSPGSPKYASIWQSIIDAAERFNEPGHFTAFIGFEWTSLVAGNNLHRNVVIRDNGDKASQIEPMVTQGPSGSTDPMDLYKWLQTYEDKTGGSVFSLAHNGNLSNGIMFPTDTRYTGDKVDQNYVELRAK